MKYLFGGKYYRLNKKYKLEKKTGEWYDQNYSLLKFDPTNFTDYIYEKTGFTFNQENKTWYRQDKTALFELRCSHLSEEIKNEFGILIDEPQWQHWNGGVFLFDSTSVDFLEDWHKATLLIFENKMENP
jgi:hypothetical protein